MKHLGLTGTRKGLTEYQYQAAELFLGQSNFPELEWIHHGDCIGVDAELAELIRRLYPRVQHAVYPAITSLKNRAFCSADRIEQPDWPLLRNRRIVSESEVILACPGENYEVLRSGTWSTVRYARQLGRPLVIVYPSDIISVAGKGKGVE